MTEIEQIEHSLSEIVSGCVVRDGMIHRNLKLIKEALKSLKLQLSTLEKNNDTNKEI